MIVLAFIFPVGELNLSGGPQNIRRKDISCISCYMLETVQLKPIKKKTNSCYVLETV